MTEKFVKRPTENSISEKKIHGQKNRYGEELCMTNVWPKRNGKSASPGIRNFLDQINRKPERADIVQVFTLVLEVMVALKSEGIFALEYAEAILSADITLSEKVELLQQSRACSFKESQGYRMDVIKVLKGDMVVNHSDGFLLTLYAVPGSCFAKVPRLVSRTFAVMRRWQLPRFWGVPTW